MKLKKLSIQEYLSLGYIYLVVLGIFSDVIYFKFLGVDILNYSTILDVLISPINIIVHDIRVFGAFTLIITTAYIMFGLLGPKFHFKYREKKWYGKLYNVEKMDKKYADAKENSLVPLVAILVLSMFVGFGIGRGTKMNSKLEKGELESSHQIIFNDKDLGQVRILGQNSGYVFYVKEKEKVISISPIVQNIKEIKKLAKNN